jgi:hypothetical protein
MMAFYIWGNQATFFGILGIFTVLGGSLLYTLVKRGENAPVQAPKLAPDEETAEMVPKQEQVM